MTNGEKYLNWCWYSSVKNRDYPTQISEWDKTRIKFIKYPCFRSDQNKLLLFSTGLYYAKVNPLGNPTGICTGVVECKY